jgi:protein-S-isoprenylcysteine O-methyltransferase Ste14
MGIVGTHVLAVSTGIAVIYAVALFAIVFVPAVITGLKGRWVYLGLGFLLMGAIWLVAMWLPAESGSWWDRHRGPGAATR